MATRRPISPKKDWEKLVVATINQTLAELATEDRYKNLTFRQLAQPTETTLRPSIDDGDLHSYLKTLLQKKITSVKANFSLDNKQMQLSRKIQAILRNAVADAIHSELATFKLEPTAKNARSKSISPSAPPQLGRAASAPEPHRLKIAKTLRHSKSTPPSPTASAFPAASAPAMIPPPVPVMETPQHVIMAYAVIQTINNFATNPEISISAKILQQLFLFIYHTIQRKTISRYELNQNAIAAFKEPPQYPATTVASDPAIFNFFLDKNSELLNSEPLPTIQLIRQAFQTLISQPQYSAIITALAKAKYHIKPPLSKPMFDLQRKESPPLLGRAVTQPSPDANRGRGTGLTPY